MRPAGQLQLAARSASLHATTRERESERRREKEEENERVGGREKGGRVGALLSTTWKGEGRRDGGDRAGCSGKQSRRATMACAIVLNSDGEAHTESLFVAKSP